MPRKNIDRLDPTRDIKRAPEDEEAQENRDQEAGEAQTETPTFEEMVEKGIGEKNKFDEAYDEFLEYMESVGGLMELSEKLYFYDKEAIKKVKEMREIAANAGLPIEHGQFDRMVRWRRRKGRPDEPPVEGQQSKAIANALRYGRDVSVFKELPINQWIKSVVTYPGGLESAMDKVSQNKNPEGLREMLAQKLEGWSTTDELLAMILHMPDQDIGDAEGDSRVGDLNLKYLVAKELQRSIQAVEKNPENSTLRLDQIKMSRGGKVNAQISSAESKLKRIQHQLDTGKKWANVRIDTGRVTRTMRREVDLEMDEKITLAEDASYLKEDLKRLRDRKKDQDTIVEIANEGLNSVRRDTSDEGYEVVDRRMRDFYLDKLPELDEHRAVRLQAAS